MVKVYTIADDIIFTLLRPSMKIIPMYSLSQCLPLQYPLHGRYHSTHCIVADVLATDPARELLHILSQARPGWAGGSGPVGLRFGTAATATTVDADVTVQGLLRIEYL